MGLTLLAKASMPLRFWDEAFRTLVFLINILLSIILSKKSLLEVLFKHKLDYSFLKVFGYSFYPNTRPYNKHKLAFKSTECKYLGFSLNHKGYKCLNKSRYIYISRDVFYETSFSYPAFSFHTSPNTVSNFQSLLRPITNLAIPVSSPASSSNLDQWWLYYSTYLCSS